MSDEEYRAAYRGLADRGESRIPSTAIPAALWRKNGAPFFRASDCGEGGIALRMPAPESAIRSVTRRAAAALLLVALSPLFLLLAACVLACDGAPVFFSQRRTGFGGKPFALLKFRTMCGVGDPAVPRASSVPVAAHTPPAEAVRRSDRDGALAKDGADPRVTRLGALLRRYSLDELPQLANIVRGEMAFVGPRPLPVEESRTDAEWQSMRFRVLPGLTGLWQVTLRNRSTFDELCRVDFIYACRRSFRLDAAILRATVSEVMRGNGR